MAKGKWDLGSFEELSAFLDLDLDELGLSDFVRILLDLAVVVVVVVALSPDLCPAAVAAPFSATSAAANLLSALAEPFVWLFTDCTSVFTFLMGDENGVCVGESTTPCRKFSLVARIQQV